MVDGAFAFDFLGGVNAGGGDVAGFWVGEGGGGVCEGAKGWWGRRWGWGRGGEEGDDGEEEGDDGEEEAARVHCVYGSEEGMLVAHECMLRILRFREVSSEQGRHWTVEVAGFRCLYSFTDQSLLDVTA